MTTTVKNKGGAPMGNTNAKKSTPPPARARVNFTVTPDVKAHWEVLAHERGLSLAAMLADALSAALPPDAAPPDAAQAPPHGFAQGQRRRGRGSPLTVGKRQ